MKNTAINANSAGWISNGFDKRTMPCEDFPGQKELLNPFKRDGRTISPDPGSGRVFHIIPSLRQDDAATTHIENC